MLEAAFWGAVGGSALVFGAVVGLRVMPRQRTIGLVMAFGAGVLISALTYELVADAYSRTGFDEVAIGLAIGALVFTAGDWWLDRRGGNHRKRSDGRQEGEAGTAIAVGAVLDGIPESIVVGVSIAAGGAVSVPIVVAIFISNVPESLSSANGMRRAGYSSRFIVGMWLIVMAVTAVSAAIGFEVVADAGPGFVAMIQGLAAGAMLAMLADTMMPEAYEDAGALTGLVTVFGFALAFYLATLE